MQSVFTVKKMGLTLNNLAVLLFRARNRLREAVERQELKRG